MPSPSKSSAPAAKKAPTPTGTKPAAQPEPAAKAPAKAGKTSPGERAKMIAEAAYYLAEKRGFGHGQDLADWAAAEKQVDALIAKRG